MQAVFPPPAWSPLEHLSSGWFSELDSASVYAVDPHSVQKLTELLAEEIRHPFVPAGRGHDHHSSPEQKSFSSSSSSSLSPEYSSPNTAKMNDWSASPSILRFGEADAGCWEDDGHRAYVQIAEGSNKRSRSPQCAREHVHAERQRREKLAQQFALLSEVVPGLKKTDKISLLSGTISYLKQLQEKVKRLEAAKAEPTQPRQAKKPKTHIAAGDGGAVESNGSPSYESTTAKVEANHQGDTVLLRIHCRNRSGALVAVFSEAEKQRLSIVNTSATQFADSSLHVIVTAKIEEGVSTAVVDRLVKNLGVALS